MAETVKAGSAGWMQDHLARYLRTDGAEGHFVDFTVVGGSASTPCLILETTGRRSGAAHQLPLIYGEDGGRFVVVASKGGAPVHPAWFLNLEAKPQVRFQVGDRKYRGVARIAAGAERARLYAMMAGIYPPYIPYQEKAVNREIPVVLLEPEATIDSL